MSNEEINVLLNESKKRNYIIGEILAYNLLGRSFRKKTLFNNALNNYEKALKLSRKTKDTGAEIVTLNQIGVIYRRLDKIKKALDYNQAALELASKVENPSKDIMMSISISNNNIGNIYLTLKQYELALKKFKKSILTQKKLGDKRGLAINNQNIGFTYKNLGFLEEALDYYNISLDYNLAIKSELGKVICYQSISDVLLLQGKHTKALKQIKKIVKLSEKIGNKYYTSLVYRSLGHAQLKLNQFDESEASLKKALNIATTYDFPTIINEANLCLSELYDKKKEYEKALNYYKKAIEGERKTFNDKNLTYVHNLTSKYDTEVSKNKITSLAKENEINSLKLLRNRNVLIIALVSIGLLGVLLYSMYRQRLLNDDKKILNLEQQALRIQMNPHFVFNALNSIKLYIINNEQRNAVYYLNKFSKLIRNILESSTIKEVTLREELDTMKLYMSIENIRFSNEIEYIENISNDVNQHQIKIPPLSLQPFLENALWHGLSSKEGFAK